MGQKLTPRSARRPDQPSVRKLQPPRFFASVRSTLECDPSTSGRCAPERWKSTANPVCKWHASQGSPEARLGCTEIMGGAMGEARYAPEQRSSASPGRDLILGPANAGYHLLRCGGGTDLAAPLRPLASCGFSANANDRSIFWDLSIRCGDRRPVTRCLAGRDPCDACARALVHLGLAQALPGR